MILPRSSFSLNGVMMNVALPICLTAPPWVISYRPITSKIGAAELSGALRSCSQIPRVFFATFRAKTMTTFAPWEIEETPVSSFQGHANAMPACEALFDVGKFLRRGPHNKCYQVIGHDRIFTIRPEQLRTVRCSRCTPSTIRNTSTI